MKTNLNRNPEVVWRELDDEVAIISSDNKSLHMLNGVGSRIWMLLDGNHNFESIVSTISSEYQAEEEVIRKDVEEYLSNLRALKLIKE